MGKHHCSSFDTVIMMWWATVWCAILGSWPAVASAAPLQYRQDDSSSSPPQQPEMSQTSQGLIAGLAAGVAVVVLTGITLVICFPPRKWARRGKSLSTRPVKPWIQQTTTTTVTSHTRSGSSESTDSLTDRAAPLPMTRITNIDKRGRYIINSKESAAAAAAAAASSNANAENDIAGPSSSRRPAASLQRYSVHVTSNGKITTTPSQAGGAPLSPLPEETRVVGAPRFLTSHTMPINPMNWPNSSVGMPSSSSSSSSLSSSSPPRTPGKSGIADRRGRPALQSIQVPSPSSPASVKGKGKARLYYH